jgi:hypothetical protein
MNLPTTGYIILHVKGDIIGRDLLSKYEAKWANDQGPPKGFTELVSPRDECNSPFIRVQVYNLPLPTVVKKD